VKLDGDHGLASPAVDEPAASARASHADRVYGELRDRLLRGEVAIGQRLVEEQLASEFRTSRTPVREALRRLEGDGHLVRAPAGGLRPNLPNVRSMSQVYEVRLVIEDLCVRRAVAEQDRPLLEAIRADWIALRDEDPAASAHGPGFVHADESFHRRIAEAAGNELAARVLREINDRIRLMRIHDFTTEDRVRATITEHLEIVDAILARDAEAAASFMRAHVQRSALVVRDRVGAALARMAELEER
jgi:DNA-binding GntR family transcriptional regulator